MWASRGAGVIGLFTAALYLALIVGQDDLNPVSALFLVVMAGSGLGSWFADRMSPGRARRVMWGVVVVFFVLGVVSVLSVGLLFLGAALLAFLSLKIGGAGDREAQGA